MSDPRNLQAGFEITEVRIKIKKIKTIKNSSFFY